MMTVSHLDSDLLHGVENLRLHKLRTLLTMLGMIFGVAAVVSMLSIGAGAQQQMMAFIEQLGVRNLIVEAKEATNYQDLQKVRKISPGLTFRDWRVIKANINGIDRTSPRKRFTPSKMLPKPQRDMPVAYGVEPNYLRIAGLQVVEGRWFDADENGHAAPVCVLGDAARAALYGNGEPLGQYLKVERAVVARCGRGSPAVDGAGGRERPAFAGPEQPDLRAALYGGGPAGGHL